MTRSSSGEIQLIEVGAISGARWRIEVKNPARRKTLVAVYDGASFASLPESLSRESTDPRPVFEGLIAGARGRPEANEQIGGRQYLRFTERHRNQIARLWTDAETRFPYRVDLHGGDSVFYSRIAVDVQKHGP